MNNKFEDTFSEFSLFKTLDLDSEVMEVLETLSDLDTEDEIKARIKRVMSGKPSTNKALTKMLKEVKETR